MNPEYLMPDWPAPAGVRALITTRRGGVSQGPRADFNLADHVADDPDAVRRNRERLQQDLPAAPHWLRQVHGTTVLRIDAAPSGPPEADAAVCSLPGQACVVLTADCLPVLFCADDGSEVGAAHAGWRGLAAGVLECTVAAMRAPPARVMAYLGPAIGPSAYEVGAEVRAEFLDRDAAAGQAFRASAAPDKYLADLYRLARQRLASAGVMRVFGGEFCTYTDAARFYSYRRDGATGRMASLVWLED